MNFPRFEVLNYDWVQLIESHLIKIIPTEFVSKRLGDVSTGKIMTPNLPETQILGKMANV
jgi:hypothetical protein